MDAPRALRSRSARSLLQGACLACALTWSVAAAADGFSCGNRVVTEGMAAAEVRTVCGEPAQVTTKSILRRPVVWRHGRPYYFGDGYVDVTVETWLYNFGTTRLMRRLRFEDGVLQDIETLGYGYNE